MLTVKPHPDLDLHAFTATLPAPLGELPSPAWLLDGLRLAPEALTPALTRDERVRAAVRDLLRHGGYKPTGRGKPASEYLVRAAENDKLRNINLVVDACNVVSLHSGLPVSVVDRGLTAGDLWVGLAAEGASYVFNPSGQTIKAAGLLSLHDASGPVANAVKDCQRTKTHDGTRELVCLVWGTRSLPGVAQVAAEWYRALLTRAGAAVEDAVITPEAP